MIDKILKEDFIARRRPSDATSLYDFTEQSAEAEFYDLLFSDESKIAERTLLDKNKSSEAKRRIEGLNNINAVVSFLKNILDPDALLVEIGGGVHQERSGYIYKEFLNYYPLDISQSSIKKYVEKFQRSGVVADATNLPFEDNSLDAIFTHTFLEHTHNPEQILSEISRVLKPGGIIVHVDAWFCRWWQRFGVVGLKTFSEMNFKERLVFIGSRITEFKPLRFPPILIKRTIQLLLHKSGDFKFRFKKLKPNYDLFLGCDEDAASSIDPVNVMQYYESRNFKNYNDLSFKEKVFFRSPFLIMKKQS